MRNTLIIAALVACTTLTGCLTVEEQIAADVNVCTQYGAEYGSPAHYQCMMVQQQRRDIMDAQARAIAAAGMAQAAYTFGRY